MENTELLFSAPNTQIPENPTTLLPPLTPPAGVDLDMDIGESDASDDDDVFQEELNIRRVFTPRPGKLFVRSDYSQLEVRIVAHYSKDPELIAAILQGGDMHSIIAHKVFKLDCDVSEVKYKYKKYRSAAKAVVFGLIYGITAVGLAEGLLVTQEEAQGYIDAFFETYPGLKTFLGSVEDFIMYSKFIFNAMGRKRRFLFVNNRALRQGKNFPVQSTASDVTTNAMVTIDERIAAERLRDSMQILMQIHDEILVECDIDKVEYCKVLMQECMQQGLSKFGIDFAVPLLTDPGVDYAWGFPLSSGRLDKPGAKEDEFHKLITLREAFNVGDRNHVVNACREYYVTYFRELLPHNLNLPSYTTLPGNAIHLISEFDGGIAAPTELGQPVWFKQVEHDFLVRLFNEDSDYDIFRAKFL